MLKLKQNYLLDPKNAKSDILSQPDCLDFPDGVWTDVILSRYINFDQVYSGYYVLDLDYKHTRPLETSTWSLMLEMDPEAQQSQSPVMANGPSLSQLSNKSASLCTPIELKSLMDTNISSLGSLQPKAIQPSTTGCLTWTDPSDYMWPGPMISCSHPSIISATSSLNISSHDTHTQDRQRPNDNNTGLQTICQPACDGTMGTAHQTLASTDTSATSVQAGTS